MAVKRLKSTPKQHTPPKQPKKKGMLSARHFALKQPLISTLKQHTTPKPPKKKVLILVFALDLSDNSGGGEGGAGTTGVASATVVHAYKL